MKQDTLALDVINNPKNFYVDIDRTEKLNQSLERYDIALYQIEEVTFEDEAPPKEALENVLSAIQIDGIHFIYLIMGDKTGVHFYFGIAKDLNVNRRCKEPDISVVDIGDHILKPSLEGNFRGSHISSVNAKEKDTILKNIQEMKHCSILGGVPGINENNEKFQGTDRLVDVMLGDNFSLMVIAKPLASADITSIENNLYHFYSDLSSLVKFSIQKGESTSTGTSFSKAISNSTNMGTGSSVTEQESEGSNASNTKGEATGETKGTSTSLTTNSSSKSETKGGNQGINTGTNHSVTNGTNHSKSKSVSENSSKGSSNGTTSTEGTNDSKSESYNKTTEFVNKKGQDWVQYLDEIIFKRLDYGKGKGIVSISIVLFSDIKNNLIKLENTAKSLYSGDSGNKVPLHPIRVTNENTRYALQNMQIPVCNIKELTRNELAARSALSQCIKNDESYVGNWISIKELSLIAGLPQKEIVGLGLRQEVNFGLNFNDLIEDTQKISLGHLIQSGHELKNIPVYLNKSHLNKHTFITGVTGSGKTTTCQKILLACDLPFLVIEPAKTEYRIMRENIDNLLIFTLGKDTVAPFRLNPFEFFKHESITSHVDMIMASIESAFDMEAAIPQIIETAIYECYKSYGWDINKNINRYYEDPFADGIYAFPTLDDLIRKIDDVVQIQGFDDRLKNDYIGSIKARLQSLTVGAKGMMLNTKRSIDFNDLLERKVVLELEEIRSGSEKSLIMGFILSNLIEALKSKKYFPHITLIEEAHRLLSRYSPGDSLNKKQSIETFSDMLAEVRKYGESLIIVDQIPSKLTPEVLKNTNTKIVHKIFAQDDKDAIGNTMILSDKQKNFLSNLETGRAIVFTQDWPKALQIKVIQETDTTSQKEISDVTLRKDCIDYYCQTYKRGVFPGIAKFNVVPTVDEFEQYIDFFSDERLLQAYRNFFTSDTNKLEFTEELKHLFDELIAIYSIEPVINYLLLLQGHTKENEMRELLIEFIEDVQNCNNSSQKIRRYFREFKKNI